MAAMGKLSNEFRETSGLERPWHFITPSLEIGLAPPCFPLARPQLQETSPAIAGHQPPAGHDLAWQILQASEAPSSPELQERQPEQTYETRADRM